MNTLPARIVRQPVTKPSRARKPKAPVVATVTVFHPAKLAALRTAASLGCALGVTFDGYTLTITAEPTP